MSARLTSTPVLSARQHLPAREDMSCTSVQGFTDGCTAVVPVRHGLSDEERELAIVRAGKAVERHMAIWQAQGCFAALGDAHRARRLMELLIKGRSAAQIALMERERGLA